MIKLVSDADGDGIGYLEIANSDIEHPTSGISEPVLCGDLKIVWAKLRLDPF
ncbi:MAG TPA: hypothetical protein VM802_20325 [Chitinophaga sp.]|uniref:hypothetical protein n=1 Tax=Chitinophaga sp. TaxID=1869181 RepID=UPI002CBFA008|nr:hypothetical protein [Chitinophaga sp.]HVI47236.1 hypothetical protein [Chitinophaga sp.]